jgi:hypothetical protein
MPLPPESFIRILIVEDNPGDAVLIQQMIGQFEDFKAESCVASSIEDAEDLLGMKYIR